MEVGNFYIMPVSNQRVARVNLACDENLKAYWIHIHHVAVKQ